jgi:outer membrane protein assembly factor BamB
MTRAPFYVAGLAITLAAAISTASVSAQWPQWHGPDRNNVSSDVGLLREWGPQGPPLAYRAAGLGIGFSSLAIANGRIYTMGDHGADQFVEALNLQDGKLLWKTKVGPQWDDEYAGPRGTPTIDGKLLYAVSTEGDVVCLDSATGQERWRRSLTRDFGGQMMSGWKFSESPLIDGDKLIVTPGASQAAIVALDKTTGKDIWRTTIPNLGPQGRDGAAYSSVMISTGAGVRQYVQLLGRGVIGVRASDGAFLWGYNRVANDVANIATPVISGDYVFASTGYQTGSALLKLAKTATGVSASEAYFLDGKTFQNHHGGYVLLGDYIYGGHGHRRGAPICIELATGKVMWGGAETRNEGSGSAAVTTADGLLFFRYENGMMMLIEATPTGYKQKGFFPIPGVSKPSWAHPVVVGGRMFLREQDNLFVYNVARTS